MCTSLHKSLLHALKKETRQNKTKKILISNEFPSLSGLTGVVSTVPVLILHIHDKPMRTWKTGWTGVNPHSGELIKM